MRLQQSLILLIVVAVSVFAQDKDKDKDKNVQPIAERLAAQNALFDEEYESDLREFPERATDFGDYRYNDKLADHTRPSPIG